MDGTCWEGYEEPDQEESDMHLKGFGTEGVLGIREREKTSIDVCI